uniref:DUF4283 domain-containing protein n=1 Tax=Tanacetum cinerariifolium TaxID=118510 RepID=A0A6L2J0T2_TANCI|nr:hypothetical protein [Tanacetum cinerariifolium]
MDKGEGEEDIFSILNNFNLKMSKIANHVGKSGDHIEKTTSSNVLRSCSDEIFGGATYGSHHGVINRGSNSFAFVLQAKSNKKVVKIQELRNENVVEGAVVAIPFEAVEEVKSRFSNTLYGSFIGKRLTFPFVENYVKNTWAKYGLKRVQLHDDFFLFQFENKDCMDKVLEDGPWLICTVPLILNVWSPNTDLKKSKYVLKSWGKSTYARALIKVSAANELLDSLVIVIPIDKDNGHTLATIDVEYEWNPPPCATCKIFDHHSDKCPKLVKDLPVVNDADEGFVEVKKKKHKNKNKGETFQKVHTDKVPIMNQAHELIVKNLFGPLDENEGDGFHYESLKQDDFLNVSDREVDEEFQVDHNGSVSSNRTGASTPANEKPKGGHEILKKLDRIMVNLEFNDVFMGTHAMFNLYRVFDHTPSVLYIPTLAKKLKNLKKPLRKLLYDKGNVHANVNKLRTNLDDIQTALDADPFNVVLRKREATCVIEINEEGETSNFNYAYLFIIRLNDQETQNMVREISNQEVNDAIFSIGDDKSPGPEVLQLHFSRKLGILLLMMFILRVYPGSEYYGQYLINPRAYAQLPLGASFHQKMVSWIMECVTSTSYSICVNGSLHGYFKGKWGLREGDPLSSYLFTLVMELMRQFLWSHESSCKGKLKVAWEIVCLPKHEGGLGIRRLECFNSALMVSHIWKLLTLK